MKKNTTEAGGNVHLFFGSDDYRADEEARQAIDQICPPEEQAAALETLDGRVTAPSEGAGVLRRAREALLTYGLFSSRKVVWIQSANIFEAGMLKRSAELKEAVAAFADTIHKGFPEGHVLVITASGVDQRSAFFKACDQKGRTLECERPEKKGDADRYARDYLFSGLKKLGLAMAPDAQNLFVVRTGTDTRLMVQELEKLALYARGQAQVTVDDVRLMVAPVRESAWWDLTDALGARSLPGALGILRQLLYQGEEPILILTTLENHFRLLLLFHALQRRGWARQGGRSVEWNLPPEGVAALSGMKDDPRKLNPYRAVRLMEQACAAPAADLRAAFAAVTGAHRQLVTQSLPPALLLEVLLVRLSAPWRAPAGQRLNRGEAA